MKFFSSEKKNLRFEKWWGGVINSQKISKFARGVVIKGGVIILNTVVVFLGKKGIRR